MTAKDPKAHRFGGDWTTAKLGVLAGYLTAYTTALKDTQFRKGYIDAFAGTGYRAARKSGSDEESAQTLLPELAAEEPQSLLDGSATIALRTDPPFDSYVFIEKSAKRCDQLENLKTEFPQLCDRIHVRQGEANTEIRDLCSKDWRRHRAVLFLDPYGMQVEWKTIEAIASTKAIDLWLLFPYSVGVNRLLTKSGEIPEAWQKRLDLFLGTKDWRERLYRQESQRGLFGDDEDRVVKAKLDAIGAYFNERLASVFAGVAQQPGVLRNSSNSPLYLLCFAVGNDKGKAKEIALRIANHLLKELR